MAISTGAAILGSSVIGAAGSLLGGSAQASAAGQAGALQAQATREAARLQAEATRLSIEEIRRQFDLGRTDLAPYRETGTSALAEYAALYGIGRQGLLGAEDGLDPTGVAAQIPNPEFGKTRTVTTNIPATGGGGAGMFRAGVSSPIHGVPNSSFRAGSPASSGTSQVLIDPDAPEFIDSPTPDVVGPGQSREELMQAARDRFMETPGYTFRFDEGIRARDRSAAARGSLRGGGYGRELTRYGQGIASEEFTNYANRLAGLAGMGQGATTSSATLGGAAAGNISNALMTGAAGQANTLMGGARAQGSAIMAAGTARASGYAGAANAIGGGMQNLMLWNLLQ